MWSFISAFRACRVTKNRRADLVSRPGRYMAVSWTSSGFALILGVSCLPLGAGCRSGSPTDWVGERMVMQQAWQGQTSQVRSEDASFQEGWRNGFQDGRSQATVLPPDREPAKFEAFMNSKRDEAMADWRRGYDAGLTAALSNDDRHQAHSELFQNTSDPAVETVQTDTTTREQPMSSLFGIPRNLGLKHESAEIRPSELVEPPSSRASETMTQPTVDFDNAAVVLDSVIKKNGDSATLSQDSNPIDAAQPGATQPAKPERSESEPGPGPERQPETNRSIIELPIHDDDVANASPPSRSQTTSSVIESSAISPPKQLVMEIESPTDTPSRLQLGFVPPAYQGRLHMGHLIANPYVTSNSATSPGTPSAEKASAVSPNQAVPNQATPNQVAPNQVAPLLTTTSKEFRAVAPIATIAPDSPTVQVKHEVKPTSPISSTTLRHLPKGLPLRKKK